MSLSEPSAANTSNCFSARSRSPAQQSSSNKKVLLTRSAGASLRSVLIWAMAAERLPASRSSLTVISAPKPVHNGPRARPISGSTNTTSVHSTAVYELILLAVRSQPPVTLPPPLPSVRFCCVYVHLILPKLKLTDSVGSLSVPLPPRLVAHRR